MLIVIALQSVLLMAAAYGLHHQHRRLQATRRREQGLVRRLTDHRDSLRTARDRQASLEEQRTQLLKQLARESSLRTFAEARVRALQVTGSVLALDPAPTSIMSSADYELAHRAGRLLTPRRPLGDPAESRQPMRCAAPFPDTQLMPA